MEITTQESAENLKEIIVDLGAHVEKMQYEYLRQSMRTIFDYFDGDMQKQT